MKFAEITSVRLIRYDVNVNIPAAFLQLDSDFQPSDSSSDQEATGGAPSAVDSSAMRDMWSFVVAAGEDDQQTADAILARGDHVKMLVQAAASHIMAQLREQGTDPVAYGRSMLGVITEKGGPGSMRDLWAFVVAAGEDDQQTADAILARGDHVEMLVWATSHIMGKLREQGTDPVVYGRSMMEAITEKEARGEF